MTFAMHIGIDYSGAQTPTSRLPGLQVYSATSDVPERVSSSASGESKSLNWNRSEVADWLMAQARSGQKFIAGIDHGFSFPLSYFERYGLKSWDEFLADFVQHWPTHEQKVSVDDLRFRKGGPPDRSGSNKDLRLTEKWTSSAKSVFLFDVQGSVAKSTHSGLPWLVKIREKVGDLVHFWPFDGWQVPVEKSVIAEVYPSIVRNRFAREDRTPDQHDAYSIACWLHEMDSRGRLEQYFQPPLTAEERAVADLEGWILGIM